jgi:hypothetical protein
MSITSSSPHAPHPAVSVMPSLLTADPDHNNTVLLTACTTMGNNLGETRIRLALTIPGLHLTTKGMVSKLSSLSLACHPLWGF